MGEEVENPSGSLGQMTEFAREFLGFLNSESLAVNMPCPIKQ
jgi:hypothetical protein